MRKTIVTILAIFTAFAAMAQEADKVALERFFMDRLALCTTELARPIPENMQRIGKNLYVSDNGSYEVESVREVSFFRRIKGEWIPVREREFPRESIITLLSGYTGDSRYTVYLRQHRYGYAMEEVEVPLNKLLAFCIIDCGFVPYVGIESIDDTKALATLFLVNRELGYSHTMLFTINLDMIDSGEGMFDAEAYTFTPIYNLAK